MYNLLIVDDEEIVRVGLKKFINWASIGFHIVGTADSGEKAIEIIKNNQVDVILTDIVMAPGMSGLELIKFNSQFYGEIISVILSGHDDFAFAKEALKHGAREYLTKPVVFEEVETVFKAIYQDLIKREYEKTHKIEYMRAIKESFLKNLVKGIYKEETYIVKRINELKLNLPHRKGYLLKLYISNQRPLKDQIQAKNSEDFIKIGRYVEQFLCQLVDFEMFMADNNEYIIILYPNQVRWKQSIEELMTFLKRSFLFYTTIGISDVFENTLQIPTAYRQASVAIAYKILNEEQKIFYYSEVIEKRTGTFRITETTKERLLDLVKLGNEKEVYEYLDYLIDEVRMTPNINIEVFYNACLNILLTIENFFVKNKEASHNEQGLASSEIIYLQESITDIKTYIKECISHGLMSRINDEDNTSSRIVEQVKNYINEHYGEQISLNLLAENLYIHPIYLSKLFKEKTSENFIDYLTRVRIEKSKKYLKDLSYKVYEISEIIGYDSPKYFSKVFKLYEGITPKEYRNKNL